MRISDWSSDVCSSDLEVINPPSLATAVAQARDVMDRPLAIYQRMTAVIPDYSAPAGFGRVALPLAGDDGRIRQILGAPSFDAPVLNGRGRIATRPALERRSAISPLARPEERRLGNDVVSRRR